MGQNHIPELDAIAWYAGNCCDQFLLPAGIDISAWPERQYSGTVGGTHAVGQAF